MAATTASSQASSSARRRKERRLSASTRCLSTLSEAARIPTSKRIVHGIAYSPDSRYAYISCESIGIDPGAVDVIDLASRTRVSTVPIAGADAVAGESLACASPWTTTLRAMA